MTTLVIPHPSHERQEVIERADRRSVIQIMVLGDAGVGKSSLISTFCSRYFSSHVPGLMQRVRLPVTERKCTDSHMSATVVIHTVTTIQDSQNGDAALLEAAKDRNNSNNNNNNSHDDDDDDHAVGSHPQQHHRQQQQHALGHVDAIILVYDLDREETFFRLERHWLPLIQKCFPGKIPVIVAENKVDLFHSRQQTANQALLQRKRQQIVSLMQQFPFVRQCIKCSAKEMVRVDDVIYKAQQAVLYPLAPLYDLQRGCLTRPCQRALQRIFRLYDTDRDGLLSDNELERFQRETYSHSSTVMTLQDRDLGAWKKVVSRHLAVTTGEESGDETRAVLDDGKFTVAGFEAIFDVFISQNRLDVVWQCLRHHRYDDQLRLHVPDCLFQESNSRSSRCHSWRLSYSARRFLAAMYRQHDDTSSIFGVLDPPALPPWHPTRAPDLFEHCFSVPKVAVYDYDSSSSQGSRSAEDSSLIVPGTEPPLAQPTPNLSSSGISILSASDSLPSLHVSPTATGTTASPSSAFGSLEDWMSSWHCVAAVSPTVARAELFRLGHVESSKRRRRRPRSTRELRVVMLGSRGCHTAELVQFLTGVLGSTSVQISVQPESTATFVRVERDTTDNEPTREDVKLAESTKESSELLVHLILTVVPPPCEAALAELSQDGSSMVFDLAMLVFNCHQMSSWEYVKELENSFLSEETPRVFLGCKTEEVDEENVSCSDIKMVEELAFAHCRASDLEDPLIHVVEQASIGDDDKVSRREDTASDNEDESNSEDRLWILQHLARCALVRAESGIKRLRSRPHEEQKRKESARRRKLIWLGGIVSVGMVVAAVGLFWRGGGSSKKEGRSHFGWWSMWFGHGGDKQSTSK